MGSDSMNKMQEIAKMFDKEIDQPFLAESEVHKVAKMVRFSLDGMQYYDKMCDRWYSTEAFLREILTGKAKIIEC